MSKKDKVIEESKNIESSPIDNLTIQLKDFREKAEYYKAMALKAEGALEILAQLEKEKGEAK